MSFYCYEPALPAKKFILHRFHRTLASNTTGLDERIPKILRNNSTYFSLGHRRVGICDAISYVFGSMAASIAF